MRAFSKSYGVVAVLGLLSSTACLQKDVTHTVYVSPTAVTWSTIEKDVRSDHADQAERTAEEQDYILGARAGRHGVARALGALGATRIETTILRDDRPFTVVTTGRFGDVGELARAVIARLGIRGDASIDRKGCERTFRAWFDTNEEPGAGADELTDVIGDLPLYRVALAGGRFTGATGFLIEADGAVASVDPAAAPEDGIVRVSLTWIEGGCGG